MLFGRKIDRTEIEDDPIFVIGHWRSGTTLLHELLVLDPRHTFPDTYACFAPNHFLVSGWLMKPCLQMLLPSRRPMDNMAAGWDHPQEDEFALCNMGVRSPYLTIAFPNHPPQDQEYLDLRGVPAAAVDRWKRALLWFLKCLTLRNPKRIVLKSPPHTCRIRTLLEMFPKAKFVHIVRDPYVIFPSTVNLWKRLYRDEGLQVPTLRGLGRARLRDLHADVRGVRARPRLDRPGPVLRGPLRGPGGRSGRADAAGLRANWNWAISSRSGRRSRSISPSKKDYKTNRYQITPEMRAEIARRWGTFIEQYGYAKEEVDGQSAVDSLAAASTRRA